MYESTIVCISENGSSPYSLMESTLDAITIGTEIQYKMVSPSDFGIKINRVPVDEFCNSYKSVLLEAVKSVNTRVVVSVHDDAAFDISAIKSLIGRIGGNVAAAYPSHQRAGRTFYYAKEYPVIRASSANTGVIECVCADDGVVAYDREKLIAAMDINYRKVGGLYLPINYFVGLNFITAGYRSILDLGIKIKHN